MQDPTMQVLGERLRAIREDRGLSRVEVAEVLECHKTNLAHIEAGRQGPTIEQLLKLARLFECTMEQLLEGALPVGDPSAPYAACVPVEIPPHPLTGDVTRRMALKDIEAVLDRRDARDAVEALKRRGVELTPEQAAKALGATEAA
jgi:transcriptional regulator with XRE-family HTH domain